MMPVGTGPTSHIKPKCALAALPGGVFASGNIAWNQGFGAQIWSITEFKIIVQEFGSLTAT